MQPQYMRKDKNNASFTTAADLSRKVQRIKDAVWAFRDNYSNIWLTPSKSNSARFVFQEAGEVLDAWVRSKKSKHLRTNIKTYDIEGEVGDVLVMLITTAGRKYKFAKISTPKVNKVCIDNFVVACADVYKSVIQKGSKLENDINKAITLADLLPSINIEDCVKKSLDKVHTKSIKPCL